MNKEQKEGLFNLNKQHPEREMRGLMMSDKEYEKRKLSKPAFYVVIALVVINITQLAVGMAHIRETQRLHGLSLTTQNLWAQIRTGTTIADTTTIMLSVFALIALLIPLPKKINWIISIVLTIASIAARFILPASNLITY